MHDATRQRNIKCEVNTLTFSMWTELMTCWRCGTGSLKDQLKPFTVSLRSLFIFYFKASVYSSPLFFLHLNFTLTFVPSVFPLQTTPLRFQSISDAGSPCWVQLCFSSLVAMRIWWTSAVYQLWLPSAFSCCQTESLRLVVVIFSSFQLWLLSAGWICCAEGELGTVCCITTSCWDSCSNSSAWIQGEGSDDRAAVTGQGVWEWETEWNFINSPKIQ